VFVSLVASAFSVLVSFSETVSCGASTVVAASEDEAEGVADCLQLDLKLDGGLV